jgi:hypothetical protein
MYTSCTHQVGITDLSQSMKKDLRMDAEVSPRAQRHMTYLNDLASEYRNSFSFCIPKNQQERARAYCNHTCWRPLSRLLNMEILLRALFCQQLVWSSGNVSTLYICSIPVGPPTTPSYASIFILSDFLSNQIKL